MKKMKAFGCSMKKSTLTSILVLLFGFMVSSQPIPQDSLYLGQTPPDTIPVIFAPGIICLDNRFEGTGAFSPDGKMIFFTVTNGTFSSQKLFFSEFVKNKWTKPDTASFSKVFNNLEPFFSFDGQKLYFSSDREKKTNQNRRDFYSVNKLKNGWSEPVKLEPPINSDYTEFFFRQSKNGTIYFASNRPGGNGMVDIYFAKPDHGKYENVCNIGSVVNVNGGYAGDPCIAPDEGYIIFPSVRTAGANNSDLFISFNEKGTWTEPVNMGNLINTRANEYGPFLSPDGKYLFFIRHDGIKGDIYWVNAGIINKLRKT
jgi:Tol biopolymer transport system component